MFSTKRISRLPLSWLKSMSAASAYAASRCVSCSLLVSASALSAHRFSNVARVRWRSAPSQKSAKFTTP